MNTISFGYCKSQRAHYQPEWAGYTNEHIKGRNGAEGSAINQKFALHDSSDVETCNVILLKLQPHFYLE